jgi:dienelactone hydrolase
MVAEEEGAEAAVAGWGGDTRVKAMALISGRLSGPAKDSIASERELPLFLIVSSEDKRGFADMTDAYFLSTNRESDIEVYRGLGIGTAMFKAFQSKFPNEKPLQQTIGDWISDKLLSTGTLTEVSFHTEDGWTIYGNLRVPQNAAARVPAVILLHSGLSDRNAYHELEAALAQAGLAVLNIDWRGKGKSTGKGKYFELSKAERDKGYLDAKGAVNFLTSQPGIDADRLGIMGTVIGAKYAMAAAADEPRIKTVIVLTGYIPTEKEKTYVSTQRLPIFYVTSRGHRAVTQSMTELYGLSKGSGSELLVYNGGAIGYQLFELDKDLLPRVVRWMKDKLSQ